VNHKNKDDLRGFLENVFRNKTQESPLGGGLGATHGSSKEGGVTGDKIISKR
jgi:hypothetical protein